MSWWSRKAYGDDVKELPNQFGEPLAQVIHCDDVKELLNSFREPPVKVIL